MEYECDWKSKEVGNDETSSLLGIPQAGSLCHKIPLFFRTHCVYTVYMTMHSWITISLGDPRPLYLQVIEQVKRRVAVGDMPPGTELPSIRELASGLKVSVITIKRAYLELEREGVILTRQGKGSVVADRPGLQSSIQEAELRDHLKQAVSLGLLLGKSKTEMQRRIAEVFEQSQRGHK
jgi:GntR family transcriptional regulator